MAVEGVEGYDLVMIGILAVAALLGYFKGIVWQLAWILGIVASGFVALRFSGQVAPFFGNQAPWNRLAAMLALYAGTSVGVWLVFRLVSQAISAVHLSSFDHQLGLLFGLAKGALLCVVITFFTVTMAPNYRQQVVNSRSGRIVAELIVRADTYLPREVHDTVDPFVRQFEREFLGPAAAGSALAGGMLAGGTAPGAAAPTISPLAAIWEGVSSAAAWASAGQEGQGAQFAGGVLPAGSSFFPQQAAEPARPTTFAPAPPSPALLNPPPSAFPAAPPSAGSAFTAAPPLGGQPAPPPPTFRAPAEVPPAGFAPGAQSPLRYR